MWCVILLVSPWNLWGQEPIDPTEREQQLMLVLEPYLRSPLAAVGPAGVFDALDPRHAWGSLPPAARDLLEAKADLDWVQAFHRCQDHFAGLFATVTAEGGPYLGPIWVTQVLEMNRHHRAVARFRHERGQFDRLLAEAKGAIDLGLLLARAPDQLAVLAGADLLTGVLDDLDHLLAGPGVPAMIRARARGVVQALPVVPLQARRVVDLEIERNRIRLQKARYDAGFRAWFLKARGDTGALDEALRSPRFPFLYKAYLDHLFRLVRLDETRPGFVAEVEAWEREAAASRNPFLVAETLRPMAGALFLRAQEALRNRLAALRARP